MNLDKINNLVELFFEQSKVQDKNKILLSSLKNPRKQFSWKTTSEYIINFSKDIKNHTQNGDRCLLISENRPEWFISDLAIMLSNSITVPTYTTYLERDYKYIINDCEPSVIIVSDTSQYEKISNLIKNFSFINKIYSFEELDKVDKNNYTNIIKFLPKENSFLKDLPKVNSKRNDPACIIYTSGTQGNPKGVILSHGGILNNCEGAKELLKPLVTKNTKFLTWLPLSHSYEHTVQFVQISVGARIFYAESIEKLIKNMNECGPQIMTAVPRFYQNLYQKISSNFKKSTGIKRWLISKTIILGHKKINHKKLSFFEKFLDKILDKTVRRKIKKQFGGELKAFVSGGGALDLNVGTFLNAIGLPTLQGYGLTETSPVVSCNPINDIRIETVGPPFKGNTVKIAQDGEILVKGENVMLGYWKNIKETEKILKDGWLQTGDIGKFENGYLRITDRKKDILITPGGDNISPVKIENEILNSDFIDQAIVYGDNKPYIVALIILNEEKDHEKEIINNEIEKINKNLSKIEKIKKYFVIKEKFSIENGMLTPTLKMKRYKIIEKYKKNFEEMY
ncbi:MAG: long-chain fatty acid--CoA ligase [Candidatus Pelagibacter sp. TMED166]|nr:MAG: long-chain fatty acid--CoA ligase [Candidatus Pelagibacter sp. TMED166]|tara:strand:- start:34390 stop:36090 length:1701 start_codon:yes stop_codon:yes gene_type:complete